MTHVGDDVPVVAFSVDVEEFDAAPPRAGRTDPDRALEVSRVGLERLVKAVAPLPVRMTLFTTVVFAERYPELIRSLARHHEIGSHGVRHAEVREPDLLESRTRLEAISGAPVVGFRMPRMGAVEPAAIARAGYRYDASLHPTWIPGRYCHLGEARRPHHEAGLLRIPASVTPRLRLPLFWLSIKHLPEALVRRAARRTLAHDGDLNLYVHPWEYAELDDFRAGRLLRGAGPGAMEARTLGLLRSLLAGACSVSYSELADRHERMLMRLGVSA